VNRADHHLHLLTDNSLDAIFITIGGVFVYANAQTCRLLGDTRPDSLIGQPLARFCTGELPTPALPAVAPAPASLRQTLQRLDGRPVIVELRCAPFRFNDQEAVLFFARDLSALNNAGDAMAQQQILLRAIIDHSTAVIFVKDPDGRYLLANRHFAGLVGRDPDTIPGCSDADLFPADIARAFQQRDREVLQQGQSCEFEEHACVGAEERTFLTIKFPLRDRHGDIYALCGIATDITARKAAEAALLELNRTLEQRIEERTEALTRTDQQLRQALTLNERILMTSSSAILVFREDGQCILANPAAARMTGGSREQLEAQNFRTLSPWNEAGLIQAADRVLKAGTTELLERQLITTFGAELWAEMQLSRFDIDGSAHLLLMMQDITDKRRAEEALANRELAYRTLASNSPDAILRYAPDGRVLYMNPVVERMLTRLRQCRAQSPQLEQPELAELERAVRAVVESGEPRELELLVPGDEDARYLSVRLVPEYGPTDTPSSVLAVGRDVTALKNAEKELRLAASVFHASAEGVMITDANGVILSVNPAFTEITGYSREEALGNSPRMLRSDRQPPEFYRRMWQELSTQGQWQGEIWNRRRDGQAYLEWLTINRIDDDRGNPARYVAVFHDITELRRKDEHIHRLAFHDALTGLPNRELLLERLQQALERAAREGRRLSITFIDLDRFKGFNDALGHDVGDSLLQQIGERLRARLRASDTVARVGGDEFVVLMENLHSARQCAAKAQQLLDEIARPVVLPGYELEISASMGMAFYPEDGDHPMELMKRADMAMYAAKGAGGDTYRFFREEMLERTAHRLRIEMDLRRALSNDELELHYQPKIDLSSGLLTELRAAGVRVAVDDFGTGYSSLAYLRRLPLDILKIDRSFVLDAVDNEEDAQIVRTILALGQSLRMEVVAEGIENERQASLLRGLGCDRAQGYLYGRPMTPPQFADWLTSSCQTH
jgi:diguanylate cyclase (GGDEF)-like protein/PAS domain S-box-containing protein